MTMAPRARGASIHYEQHGPSSGAVPLLLTHGFGASLAMWAPNIDRLSATRPVITWDVRGHGATHTEPDPAWFTHEHCVADMIDVLDRCGVDQVVAAGLSLGGFLSLSLAVEHPARVRALGLFDTGPGFKNDEARGRWNEYARAQARAIEASGAGALGDSPEVTTADHDQRGLALAASGILTQCDGTVIHALGRISVPTLVVVGSEDRAFLSAADYLASHIPGAEHHVIEGAGHAANIDRPDDFNDVVGAFLAGLD
jgi:pimeloyl-ACP methyl ester carboxylesterase